MKNFIKKIVGSDETTRKLWLVIFSSISLLIIVGTWIVYKKATLPTVAQIEKIPAENLMAKTYESGVKDTLFAGLKFVSGKIRNLINQKRGFSVSHGDRDFVMEDLSNIPKIHLP